MKNSLKISKRADEGNNYGVILVPEGLIEFIPEVNVLIKEINEILDMKNQCELINKLREKMKSFD